MADRYWVGGTADWDNTAGTKWSATDGGLGGASVPTTADDVFFTASSTGTCTIASGNTGAKSINCTGFTGTLAGSATISIAGSLTLVSGMTYSYTGTITFTGTGTLTSAGKSFRSININGSGITTTLGDALTIGLGSCTLTQGTFDTAGYNLSATTGLVATGSGTKTLNLNASTVTISGNQGVTFELASNLTFNAGTSQINLSGSGAGLVTGSTAYTFYNVTYTSTVSGNRQISGNLTFNNLTVNAPSSNAVVSLLVAQDFTVTNALTASATSVFQRVIFRSSPLGATRTITAATLSANDCDFRDITIAGGAAGTSPTRAGDLGGNSNITFPAAKTVYRVGTDTTWAGSSSWATLSGGTGDNNNLPLAQDTAIINDDTTLTGTLTVGTYSLPTINCSTRTTGITLSFGASTIYGSLILGSGITVSGTSTVNFSGRGSVDLETAGKSITFTMSINSISGTVTLQDALIFSGTANLQLVSGAFNANNFSVTTYNFSSNIDIARTLTMGSGLWTLTGANISVWDVISSNFTFNKDTANILLSDTSTFPRTFVGGGLTYNKLTIGGATGTSTLAITGVNTFSELASTKTVAHTITFSNNQTIGTWSITGTSGNVVALNSNIAGTARTLTKSGGGFLTGIDYLNVRDVVGSPTDTWYIGSNSVYNTIAPNTARGFFLTQRANNAIVVLVSTFSSTWTVPSDWNNYSNTIHLIGGGGGGAGSRASGNNRAGGGGGGGGGYTQLTNQTLTVGAIITYQAGSAGTAGSAGNNGGSGGTTSWNAGASTAGGGGGGQASTTPSSTGGTAGVGSTYNGGVGGVGASGTAVAQGYGGGGGAGAAGPNGAGGSGGNGFGSTTGNPIQTAGGGGGGNGGGGNGGNASTSTGGTGGNNALGTGGGASNTSGVNGGGGGGSVTAASVGGIGIEIFGAGSGGGAGGADSEARTNTGGLYGAGGGGGGVTFTGVFRNGSAGAQGAIIIVYTPSETGRMLMVFN